MIFFENVYNFQDVLIVRNQAINNRWQKKHSLKES